MTMADVFIIAFGIALGLSLFGLYRAIAELVMTIISEIKEKQKEKKVKEHKTCYTCAYYYHIDSRYAPLCKYHGTTSFSPVDGCSKYKEELCNTNNQMENS